MPKISQNTKAGQIHSVRTTGAKVSTPLSRRHKRHTMALPTKRLIDSRYVLYTLIFKPESKSFHSARLVNGNPVPPGCPPTETPLNCTPISAANLSDSTNSTLPTPPER